MSRELLAHVPFTVAGSVLGIAMMLGMLLADVPRGIMSAGYWVSHPLHIVISALATTAMCRSHRAGGLGIVLGVGYVGSVGIASLSDCLIPFAGETLLNLPQRELHLGFVEQWWWINPLALGGIALGFWRPNSKVTHAGHVLVSTWASLFHLTLALGRQLDAATIGQVGVFLFLSVWVPCCTSDIVFPLLFSPANESDTFAGKQPDSA